MHAAADFLLQLCPDMICLQEVTPAAWDVLEERLAPLSAEFCPRTDGHSTGEASPALCFSKDWKTEKRESFWFSETPGKPSRAWGAVHPRVCSGLKLRHRNPTMLPLWLLSLHLDHSSKAARANSLKLLANRVQCKIRSGAEVIICGDFNMPAYCKPMRDLLSETGSLRNAAHLHPVESLKPTYLGWSPLRLAQARIDHCLHSNGWKTERCETHCPCHENSSLSDHCALSVDLSPSED
jgi:endonuclease/exonuclease/phosphatase family metal-dependent hydrolase